MFDGIPPNSLLPLSFVTCVSSCEALRSHLLASACLGPDTSHELIAVANCPSAAHGLNIGLTRAKHDWVVGVHQDVWLQMGWDRCLAHQLDEAERRFGPVGVAGVYGVGDVIEPRDLTQPLGAGRIGWVIDRGRELHDGPELPAPVATLVQGVRSGKRF